MAGFVHLVAAICAAVAGCIGASLGIAVCTEHGQLIPSADLAMYGARRYGNNQYRLGHDLASNAAPQLTLRGTSTD